MITMQIEIEPITFFKMFFGMNQTSPDFLLLTSSSLGRKTNEQHCLIQY